jgi:iron complex outermembrane receptor protein
VEVVQQYSNTVRVKLVGTEEVPTAQVNTTGQGIALNVSTEMKTAEEPAPAPTPEEEPAPTPQQPEAGQQEPIELVVTATRTEEDPLDVPRSVTIIDRAEIEQQSSISNNVADIISRSVPGFGPPNLSNRANAQSLRGREFSVLIDGVPQRSNRSPNVQLEHIEPGSIERIEVVSGPTAIYGAEALGGVINIITRDAAEEPFVSTLEVGLNNIALGSFQGESIGNELKYSISGDSGSFDYRLSLNRTVTGDFYDAEGDLIPTDNRTLDNTETLGILGKVGFDIDEEQRLELNLTYNKDDRDVEILPVDNGDGKTLANEETIEFGDDATDPEIWSLSTYLTYSHDDLFLDSAVEFQTYYRNSFQSSIPSDARGDFFFDAIIVNPAEEETFGGQLTIDTPLSQNADLTWGVDFEWQRNGASITEEADPEAFDEEGIFRTVNEYDNLAPAYDLNSFGLFGQLQWDVTNDIILSGGIRHDRFGFSVDDYVTFYDDDFNRFFDPNFDEQEAQVEGGDRDFDSTVFNLGAVFKIPPTFSVFVNFSKGFSVPQFRSFLGFPPTPSTFTIDGSIADLQPQEVDQFEVGMRGNWDSVQFSLAAFHNTSDLGARLVPNERDILELQRAPERVYGVEASVDWQPVENWQFGGVVGWNEGARNPAGDEEGFEPLNSFQIQPIKLTAYVQNQTTPGWQNRLQFIVVGDRDRAFEEDVDPEPIEGYFLVDYISSIRIGEGTLQLGIYNLLDNQYSSVFSQALRGDANNFAESGRTVTVNYRLSW